MKSLFMAVKDYLNLRRELGFKMLYESTALPDFVSFLKHQHASYITTKLALHWATEVKDVQPAHWTRRLRIVRLFAQYWNTTDPRTEIPPVGLIPHQYHRKSPYIYSNDEIVRLIRAAKKLTSPKGLRSWTCSTLFGLLAVTGMRISECVGLNCDDVDLTHGLLTIRGTKFNKSRLIPIHSSTQSALQHYAYRRDRIYPKPKTLGFFVTETGNRLLRCGTRWTFVKLSHQIGLRDSFARHGPRLHDFRHTFAVRTLLHWYRTGADVEQHIPELATYLGHTHVNDTYWYLSATPELLQLAAKRLNHIKGGLLS